MNSIFFKAFFCFVLLFSFCFVQATGKQGVNKIAVLDFDKIFTESAAGMKLKQEVEKKRVNLRDVYATKEKEIKEKSSVLESQKSSLKQQVYREKEDELNKYIKTTIEQMNAEKSDLEKQSSDSATAIVQKVGQIANSFSKKNEIDVVFHKGQVVFYSENIADITDAVLNELNQALPEVKLTN